ncbi:hypothetical protein F385_3623 [Pantoea agglomerans 299R]|nr:hypothetical protein F385_3623 [Pantoea agglomerans 299R]
MLPETPRQLVIAPRTLHASLGLLRPGFKNYPGFRANDAGKKV